MGTDSRRTPVLLKRRAANVRLPAAGATGLALVIAAAALVPVNAAPTSQPATAPAPAARPAPPTSRPAEAAAAAPTPPATRPAVRAAAAIPASRPAAPAAAAAGQPAAQPGRGGPDLSSPQSAARAYADVVLGGDARLVRVVTTGSDAVTRQAEAAAGHAAALYDFANAMGERFGDEGRRFAPDSAKTDRAHFFELLGKARLTTADDTATYFEPTSGWRLALRKSAGGWRVELPKPIGEKEDTEITDRAVETLNGQAGMLRDLSAEIRAGRFKTVQEVDKARRDRDRRLQKEILKIK
jgi:hypothetical protein